MSQRLLASLTWAVATSVATTVGFLAVITVGDVLRGTGPLGRDFSIATAPTDEPRSTPVDQQFHHALGDLEARCEGRWVELVHERLAPGVTLLDADRGPDEDVHLEVRSSSGITRLEAYCNHGEPRFFVDEPAFGS